MNSRLIGEEKMIALKDIVKTIDSFAPFDSAEEWDNVGLLIGSEKTVVKKAIVALDVTEEVIELAVKQGAQVIVSHHPVLFDPIKQIEEDSVVYLAIQKGIACIAVHTNLDKADGGVNDCLCKTLHLTNCKPICDQTGRVGTLKEEMSPMDFAKHVKDCLGTSVQAKLGKNPIKTVAVVSGGGGEFLQDALDEGKADAFVTGEMKHHMWLKVKDETCVVAGHYATENVVVPSLCSLLNEKLPDIEWICYLGEAPYQTV